MTPKFDNLASLLMEVETPQERADRIEDEIARGYGKSKRVATPSRERQSSRPPQSDVDDEQTKRGPRIKKPAVPRMVTANPIPRDWRVPIRGYARDEILAAAEKLKGGKK
jgi:hypothetical protein